MASILKAIWRMGHLHNPVDAIRIQDLASHGIASVVQRELVSLPSWFPVDRAAAILRHHATTFAFVTDRTGICGTASLADLASAPRSKSVSWAASPLGRAIPLDTSPSEALASMRHQGVDHLPAFVGGHVAGLIVGIVTRASLEAAESSEAEPSGLAGLAGLAA